MGSGPVKGWGMVISKKRHTVRGAEAYRKRASEIFLPCEHDDASVFQPRTRNCPGPHVAGGCYGAVAGNIAPENESGRHAAPRPF